MASSKLINVLTILYCLLSNGKARHCIIVALPSRGTSYSLDVSINSTTESGDINPKLVVSSSGFEYATVVQFVSNVHRSFSGNGGNITDGVCSDSELWVILVSRQLVSSILLLAGLISISH